MSLEVMTSMDPNKTLILIYICWLV